MLPIKSTPILFLLLLFLAGCNTHQNKSAQLGEIEFVATGKEEAQPFFKKGILLLHSFEYEDAAEEFQKAIEKDKDFVMAYWGEAMTHNHSLWRYQDFEKATAILNQLSSKPEERVAKAKTELEKDFITAINILYGSGTKAVRDSGYAAFMGSLYKKYPGNNEVTAFYSIALIGSVQEGRDIKVYELAAEKAKEVLLKNPKHPGALHYIIHAYDDPQHAALAINIANEYSTVAPEAGHALHMPTHIYLALGMWDKVISSNIVSWQAGQKRKERKNLNNDALNYHAYHWLMYAYLQQGNKKEANNILQQMKNYCTELTSDRAREYVIYQKATYLTETNEYGSEINTIEVKVNDLNITTRAMNHFANGMSAYAKKDIEGMYTIILKMTGERLADEERLTNNGAKLCGSINSAIPNKLDIQQAEVMELELKAMWSMLNKDAAAAEKLLKRAVEIETAISYAFGPPTIVKPSFELYGEWLLQQGKPKEAAEQFAVSLKAAPGRLLSVKGKEAAEKQVKNNATASL